MWYQFIYSNYILQTCEKHRLIDLIEASIVSRGWFKYCFNLLSYNSRVHALQITRGPQNADYLSRNPQVNALQAGKTEACVEFLRGQEKDC